MKAAYIVSFLAAAVSASKFTQFPTSITCEASDKTAATFIGAQLIKTAEDSIKGKTATLIDIFGASNTATSYCNTFRRPLYQNPLYAVSVGETGSFMFGYDKTLDEFVYCGSLESLPDAVFIYGKSCDEQF